jgi:protein CLEC16A
MWRETGSGGGGGADGGNNSSGWLSNLFGGLLATSAATPPPPPPPLTRSPPRRRFTLDELRALCATLGETSASRPQQPTPAAEVEAVRALAEYVLWADQHGDDPPGILDTLLEHNVMRLLARALSRPRPLPSSSAEVARQVLQTVGIVVQSVRSPAALYLLLSGGRVNALLDAVDLDLLDGDDESLGHYASLIKTLALRLDPATVPFFLVLGVGGGGGEAGLDLAAAAAEAEAEEAAPGKARTRRREGGAAAEQDDQDEEEEQQEQDDGAANKARARRLAAMAHDARFPLYTRAIALAHHRDGMVRAAARTVTLCVFGVREQQQQQQAHDDASNPPPPAAGMGNAAAAAAAAAGLTAAALSRVGSPSPFPIDSSGAPLTYDDDQDGEEEEEEGKEGRRAAAAAATLAAAAALAEAAPRRPRPPPHHPDVTAFVTLAPAARGYFDELAAYLSRQAIVLDGTLQSAAASVDALFVGRGEEGGGGAQAAAGNTSSFSRLQQAAQASLSELDSHLAEVEDVASYAGDVAAVAAPPVARALGAALWRGVVEPLLLAPLAAAGGERGATAAAPAATTTTPLPLCPTTALYVCERLLQLVTDEALAHRLIAALLHPRVLPGLLAAASGGGGGGGDSDSDAAPPLLSSAVAAARRSHFALRLIVAAITCRHASPRLLSGLLGAPAPKSMSAAAKGAGAAGGGGGSGGGNDDSDGGPKSLPTLVREVDEAIARVLPGAPGNASTPYPSSFPPPAQAARDATRSPLLGALTAALSSPAAPPAAVALAAFALHELGAGCDAPPDDAHADAAEAASLAAVDAAQAALARALERGMWPDAAAPLVASDWPAARERALRPRGSLLRASAEALLCAPHAQPMLAACAPAPSGWVPLGLGGGGGGGQRASASPDHGRYGSGSRRRTPLPPRVAGDDDDDDDEGSGHNKSRRAANGLSSSSPRPCSRASSAAALGLPPSAAAQRAHAAAAAALASAPAPPALPHHSRSAREALAMAAACGRLCAALQAADLLRAGVIPLAAPHLPPDAAAVNAAAASSSLSSADALSGSGLQEGQMLAGIDPRTAAPCLVSFAPGRERRVLLTVAGGVWGGEGAGGSSSTTTPLAVLADPGQGTAEEQLQQQQQSATVLSVAPLVSAEPSPDPNVARWLHVHVRPSARGLLRAARAAGGAGGGGAGGGSGGMAGAGKRGGLVVAARALADGHWVLAFAHGDAAAAAAGMLNAQAARVRQALAAALAPVVGLEGGEAAAAVGSPPAAAAVSAGNEEERDAVDAAGASGEIEPAGVAEAAATPLPEDEEDEKDDADADGKGTV